MQLGFIGLGKMGSRMVLKLAQDGHEVVVWNRSLAPVEELKSQSAKLTMTAQNISVAPSVEDLVKGLQRPRVVWLMLPAGEATEEVLTEVAKHVDPEDIVIDGGNAHYRDTQRRFETFALNKVRFLGIGISGGLHGFTNGYPLMVGGDSLAYRYITTVLDSLAKPDGGYEYFGEGGAGHFVKMVHNGIEYGMMQAIGEGFGVLDAAPYELDLLAIAKLWQKGTIVSGFLMDCTKDALEKDPSLSNIIGEIAASGEGEWTVEQAKKEGVPIETIEQALQFREQSQRDSAVRNSFTAKLIATLRHEFGGHPLRQGVSEQPEASLPFSWSNKVKKK